MLSSMQTNDLSDRRSQPRLSQLALDDLLHKVHALQFSINAARRQFETEDPDLGWPSEPRAPARDANWIFGSLPSNPSNS